MKKIKTSNQQAWREVAGALYLLIIAIAVLVSVLLSSQSSLAFGYDPTHEEKIILSEFAYSVLDSYFDSHAELNSISSEVFGKIDYFKVFISLIHNGKLRCCQSGSTEVSEHRLYFDTIEAVIECIEDDRFGGFLTEDEYPDVEIVFNFLYDRQKLEENDLYYLGDNIELGIHAIELRRPNYGTYFKESVPISNNYDLEKTLARLCNKAGLGEDCYQDPVTSIYKYNTLTFKVNRDNEVIDLYRYNILIDLEEVTNAKIKESIQLGGQWFLSNLKPFTGILEYKYYPSSDRYSTSNNHVRQLASLWAISELAVFFDTDIYDELINKTLDYYLRFKTQGDYLLIEGESKIAYNAFMILALLNTDYPGRDDFLVDFGDALLSQQYEDGSYHTYFASEKNTGIDYYPGESMLALMELYNATQDQRYLDSVEKAFPYYREYWRNNMNTAFVPWHSQVYLLLYQQTKDPEVADFVFEMSDWIIDNFQVTKSEYIDAIGGFPRSNPRNATSVYLEGLNDAYRLAVLVNDKTRQKKYAQSIMNGARFILQSQYHEKNTFYLTNPDRAMGGFKESLVSNEQRNDYTQHAVLALIKTYENNLFE